MQKHALLFAVAVLSASALASCGQKLAANSDATTDAATDAAAMQLAANGQQGQSSKPQSENLNCPLAFNLPKGEADVKGISAGANLDQAILFIKCQNKGTPYNAADTGRNFADGAPGARQLVRVTDGTPYGHDLDGMNALAAARREYLDTYSGVHHDYYLEAMGPKGAETVSGVWYAETFVEGKYPTIADTAKALIAKYGPPSDDHKSSDGESLTWVYDAHGGKLSRTSDSLKDLQYMNCLTVSAKFNGMSLSPACGLTIKASIEALPKNQLLAASLSYGFINQAQMFAALDKQRALNEAAKQSRAQAATANTPKL